MKRRNRKVYLEQEKLLADAAVVMQAALVELTEQRKEIKRLKYIVTDVANALYNGGELEEGGEAYDPTDVPFA